MPDILITPPIRTPLTSSDTDAIVGTAPDSSGVTRTTRDWWLYWNRLGDQANANAKLVSQGTHADRPTATDSPDGALYVESDRGTIYQNQNGVWRYVAGTMWGTVTPDQRPTDLGVNDGGFDFRGTDDAREFIWSQTQWIEVTEVRYGTHAGRPNPLDVANGALYVEFDRGGVIYQNQNNVWKYLAGTMWGTVSPDQRPTDLGVNDGGFDFRGTDQQREFIWSQTAWIDVTPGQNNLLQYATSSTNLTLTTTMTDVAGMTLTLPRTGTHLVIAVMDFIFNSGDGTLVAQLVVNGTPQGAPVTYGNTGNGRATVAQQWPVTTAAINAVIKIQANKQGGTAGSFVTNLASFSALWVSP
jgi:hypothetical protein